MGPTEKIASFVAITRLDTARELSQFVKRAIIDCFGVTLAGATQPVSKAIVEYVRERGGNSEAGVIGAGFKTSAPLAALAAGTMAHALDYDDYSFDLWMHPSACVLPVILSLGQAVHASGKGAMEAFAIGFEVEAKLGMAMDGTHYRKGWHTTGTVGTIGAAAAAARLLGLKPEQVRMALGIASSMAGGLRQNFGSMTKPLHAGNAAHNGITAALLARSGFTADPNIMEAGLGFHAAFSGEHDLAAAAGHLGDPFAIISPGVAVKPFPSCGSTHRCIDTAINLRKKHRFSPQDIVSIDCVVEPLTSKVLIHHRPRTELQAKFCLEYCVAVALLDGSVGLRQLTDSRVLAADVQDLLQKVNVHVRDIQDEGRASSLPHSVTVKLKDGKHYSLETSAAKGEPDNPLQDDELVAKYRDCARTLVPGDKVERCLDMLTHLDELSDMTQLMDMVTNVS